MHIPGSLWSIYQWQVQALEKAGDYPLPLNIPAISMVEPRTDKVWVRCQCGATCLPTDLRDLDNLLEEVF